MISTISSSASLIQSASNAHMQTEYFFKFVKKAAEKLELLEVKRLVKINI